MKDGLKSFIMVDNYEAVIVGDVEIDVEKISSRGPGQSC